MGFSLGGSKNKSNAKTTNNQNSTSTSTVNVPSYIQGPTQDYYGLVSKSMGNLFGTGAGATTAAAGAGDPNAAVQAAQQYDYMQAHPQTSPQLEQSGNDPIAPANTGIVPPAATPADSTGTHMIPGASPQQQAAYDNALKLGNNQGLYNAAAMFGFNGGSAPSERGTTAAIAPTSNVSTTNVNGIERVNPIQLAAAQLFGGTNAGNAALADRVNLGNASQYGGTTVDPAKQFDAQSILTNLSSYMNPYTNDVVNTTLAGYDQNAASQKAAMAAQAAKSGAFAGSRYGLASSNFDAQTGQNRAATEAGLRSNAFTAGAALSGSDADRRQSAAQTNTAAQNAVAAQQAALNQETGLSNTAAQNTFSLNQGQLDQTRNLANMGAQNDRSALQANLNQQTGIFNTGQVNDRSLAQGTMDYNVGSTNAGAQNARSAQQAQLEAAKAQADAAAANSRAMQQAQLDQQMSQFNATQGENEKNRQLAAAALFGNLGNSMGDNSRANIATQLAAGADNRGVQVDQNTEELQKLAAIQGLLGVNPASLFGSTTTGNTNGTGTQKGTSYGLSAGATWG